MLERRPEQCPLRRVDDRVGVSCGWLEEHFAELPSNAAVVSDAICEACCRSFLPTEMDWNPVVSSLAWSRVDAYLPTLALDSPARKSLALKQERAESFLPLVTSDEEDLPRRENSALRAPRVDVEQLVAALPEARFGGGPVRRWAVGVTTAPRRLPTLEACLVSLAAVGWDAPRLFVDGDFELPARATSCPRTTHVPALGAWRNYYLALTELLRVDADADGVLIVQDDALWPCGAPLQEYLGRCAWPTNASFVVSFYCCADYSSQNAGWREFDDTWVYGAVALGFSRAAAEQFVSDPLVLRRCEDSRSGGIDTVIGEWAARRKVPVLVPTPSVVQHVGDVSTLWETSRAVGVRRAARTLAEALDKSAAIPGES